MKKNDPVKKRNLVIAALLLVTALAVVVTVWTAVLRGRPAVLAPDYAPRETERNAEPIEGDEGGEKLEQPQGGGAVSVTYSKAVSVDLSDGLVSLLFANPSRSGQNILLQIVAQDAVLAQSGLLEPGRQVTRLTLSDAVRLSEGSYDGRFVVFYYDRETGERAMLNTEIPLSIQVQN